MGVGKIFLEGLGQNTINPANLILGHTEIGGLPTVKLTRVAPNCLIPMGRDVVQDSADAILEGTPIRPHLRTGLLEIPTCHGSNPEVFLLWKL